MAQVKDSGRARTRIVQQAERIPWLRGTGPNPFDYYQWDARTTELLTAIFGADSTEIQRYYEAAGVRGRLPGVRGEAENMTLNIHGPWGIRARLDRAEKVLGDIIAGLAQPAT